MAAPGPKTELPMTKNNLKLKNHVLFVLSGSAWYQLRQTLLLVSIPLLCGLLLLMIFLVFTRLNLYFLEANGLILDEQVRDGYFQQMEMEIGSVIGYLGLQLVVTFIASLVVMRWATAPFNTARRMIKTALESPDQLKPGSRWLSESPAFDRLVWQFALRIRSGGEGQATKPRFIMINYPFLGKFLVVFGILSVSTGYVMSIIMDTVYGRVVELAIRLVSSRRPIGHYFIAQQEILQTANTFTIGLSMLLYLVLGLQISRYMNNMIFVFSRAIYDDRFPLTLRTNDIYGELADEMNKARKKIRAP